MIEFAKQGTKNNEQRTPKANNEQGTRNAPGSTQHLLIARNKEQKTTNNERRRQTTNTEGEQRTPKENNKSSYK
jgi:hypothetical protein